MEKDVPQTELKRPDHGESQVALPENDSVLASSIVEFKENKEAAGTMPPLGARSSRRTLVAEEIIVAPNKGKQNAPASLRSAANRDSGHHHS